MTVKASMSFLGQDSISLKLLLRLGAVTILAWLPALIGHPVVGRVASLAALAESPHPYFVPQHTALLYVWTPLVVASACILFMSPGLFLALALGAGQTVGRWVLSGLALSLVVLTPVVALAGMALGDSLRGRAFAVLVAACALGCLAVLAWRQRRGAALAWPFAEPHAAATALSMVAVPVLVLVTLLPKFFWENFNGDGAHAFETTRLLLFQPLPFWDSQAGAIASFPGMTSMLFAFPAAWFVRLFGEVEVSARLPYLLVLAGPVRSRDRARRCWPASFARSGRTGAHLAGAGGFYGGAGLQRDVQPLLGRHRPARNSGHVVHGLLPGVYPELRRAATWGGCCCSSA